MRILTLKNRGAHTKRGVLGRVRPAFLREDHAPDSASLGVVSTPVLWAVRGESRLGECALPVSAAASEAALWGEYGQWAP